MIAWFAIFRVSCQRQNTPAGRALDCSLHPELQLRRLDIPLWVEVPTQPIIRLRFQVRVRTRALVHRPPPGKVIIHVQYMRRVSVQLQEPVSTACGTPLAST